MWAFSASSARAASARVEPIAVDAVVIGSGIGGLSAGAMLAASGYSVVVCESHYEIGGVAHEFFMTEDGQTVPSDRLTAAEREGPSKYYKFEAGPSLYTGLSDSVSPNPLKHVFQMIGHEPKWVRYDRWTGFFEECIDEGFSQSIGAKAFEETLRRYGGPAALDEWGRLSAKLRPLTKGIMRLPSVALRSDLGVLRTLVARYPGPFIDTVRVGSQITAPFSSVLEELKISDPFLKNYLNLLCFLLQGLPAEGTLTAVMAYMIDDFFKPDGAVDYPLGGSGAIAGALERGIVDHGSSVLRRAHVQEILVVDGRAAGVRLRDGREFTARRGVISNADALGTYRLVPPGACEAVDKAREELQSGAPLCESFLHLHVGIDAADLPADIAPQWTVCQSWTVPIDAPGNVIVVSMPSLLDPTLAPAGRHVIHAYTAGNEPYGLYEKYRNDQSNPEYLQLKEQRAELLWRAIEKVIPDVRKRAKLSMIGTPLTHERFNRRYRGSYGPAIAAGGGAQFPGPRTPLPGLFRCGDSTNPGIGVPAVASSGAAAAAAILSVGEHLRLLERVRI